METTVQLAPQKPRSFNCPECKIEGYSHKLKFTGQCGEQWGCVVTRHDYYRCPSCKDKFVSTNGRQPELAADI